MDLALKTEADPRVGRLGGPSEAEGGRQEAQHCFFRQSDSIVV